MAECLMVIDLDEYRVLYHHLLTNASLLQSFLIEDIFVMWIFFKVYAVSHKPWVMASFNWFMFFYDIKQLSLRIYYLFLRAGVKQPSMCDGGLLSSDVLNFTFNLFDPQTRIGCIFRRVAGWYFLLLKTLYTTVYFI